MKAGGNGGGGSWATGGGRQASQWMANAGPSLSTCRKAVTVATASQTRGLLNGGAPRYAKGKASAKAKAEGKG